MTTFQTSSSNLDVHWIVLYIVQKFVLSNCIWICYILDLVMSLSLTDWRRSTIYSGRQCALELRCMRFCARCPDKTCWACTLVTGTINSNIAYTPRSSKHGDWGTQTQTKILIHHKTNKIHHNENPSWWAQIEEVLKKHSVFLSN